LFQEKHPYGHEDLALKRSAAARPILNFSPADIGGSAELNDALPNFCCLSVTDNPGHLEKEVRRRYMKMRQYPGEDIG
jgi:hypothetical protein